METTKTYNFSWIPFYMEFADKLLEYKNNRKELLDIVYGLGDYVNYISLSDREKYPDIDPFTVLGIFNRGLTIENRKRICQYFKEKFSLSSNVPESFDGIPGGMVSTYSLCIPPADNYADFVEKIGKEEEELRKIKF